MDGVDYCIASSYLARSFNFPGWMEWNRSGSYGGYGEERRHALCDH